MKKVVVLSGAGISAESGLKTFRDGDGLWENYRIEDVATPEAWVKNRKLVLDFYNERRRQVMKAMPNAAHLALAQLQNKYDVNIITQNIDDLHERAGSKKVLHLHGEIFKSRSSINSSLVYTIAGTELHEGEKCAEGSQLRPHIVWFGEMVPALQEAAEIAARADIFIVIGTSLAVYPAAGLIDYVSAESEKYIIDPNAQDIRSFIVIREKAVKGVSELVDELLNSI